MILVINEGLFMSDHMEHSLINPNQLRAFGTEIQDNPFDRRPMVLTDPEEEVSIPLSLKGSIVVLQTRTPTQTELETCKHLVLSSPREWNPNELQVPEIMAIGRYDHRDAPKSIDRYFISAVRGEAVVDLDEFEDGFDLDAINRRIIGSVRVAEIPKEKGEKVRASAVALPDPPIPKTFVSEERKTNVTATSLAEKWMISVKQAADTLRKTTQSMFRSALLPISRRYKADRMYDRKRLSGTWFSDTIDGRVKSRDGNRYAQIFANGNGFSAIYPMDSKSKAGDALRVFCEEFGVPESLVVDGSKEQTGRKTDFMSHVQKHNIKLKITEANRPNQSPAEGVVREVRRKWYRAVFAKQIPRKLWDYVFRWSSEVLRMTHVRSHRVDGGVPLEDVTGETVNISEYLDFGIYDRVWYHKNAGLGVPKLGC
jgi:hypothetical protein